jgi:uncharacterized protein YcfL
MTHCAARNVHVESFQSPGQGLIMQMKSIVALAGLMLAACGSPPEPAANTGSQTRIFDTQRSALDKAKAVNETVMQADQARRAQEEAQAK